MWTSTPSKVYLITLRIPKTPVIQTCFQFQVSSSNIEALIPNVTFEAFRKRRLTRTMVSPWRSKQLIQRTVCSVRVPKMYRFSTKIWLQCALQICKEWLTLNRKQKDYMQFIFCRHLWAHRRKTLGGTLAIFNASSSPPFWTCWWQSLTHSKDKHPKVDTGQFGYHSADPVAR